MSIYYKGISFPFRIDGRGGVATSELTPQNLERIKESIAQIVRTNIGERIMEVTFGSNISRFVFSNLENISTRALLKHELTKAIEKWEKRVVVDNVEIYSSEEYTDKYGVQVNDGTFIIEVGITVIKFKVSTVLNITI